jgi:hypothetical protein
VNWGFMLRWWLWRLCFAELSVRWFGIDWKLSFVVWKRFVGGVFVEEFLVRVLNDGKVTVPKRLRSLCGVGDGDYVRLALVEVLKRNDVGVWEKRRVK